MFKFKKTLILILASLAMFFSFSRGCGRWGHRATNHGLSE